MELSKNQTAAPYHLLITWNVHHFSLPLALMILLSTAVILKCLYSLLKRITTIFPESLLLILVGAGIGCILNYVFPPELDYSVWQMTPQAFFQYLLPACVLDSAYNLHNRVFGDCIGGVVVYAVLATVFNMVLIGLILFWLELNGYLKENDIVFGIHIIMVYASLIVAVDPVAVLAIFHEIGVELSLYYLVLGESLLNDAVCLVLYKIVVEFLGTTTVTGKDMGIGIAAFFTINLGAIFIGLLLGILSCLITRIHTHFEVFFIFILAYLSYVLGDVLGWSGIVSMITCGMIQSAYAFHNLEDNTLHTVRGISKILAEICEAIIFLLIGIQIIDGNLYWHTSFILWSLAACLLVRTVVVIVLTIGLNQFNVNFSRITMTDQFILAYGGLRGAVALSLAIMLDKKRINTDNPHIYDILVTSTLFTILFTVGIMGPTMKPLVHLLRIRLAEHQVISLVRELNEKMIDHLNTGVESISGTRGRNSIRAFFVRLDEKYIRKCLQRNPQTYDEKIVEVYEEMALLLHYASVDPEKSGEIMEGLPQTIKSKHLRAMDEQHELDEANRIRDEHESASKKHFNPNPFSGPQYQYFDKKAGKHEDFSRKYARLMNEKKRRVLSMTSVRPIGPSIIVRKLNRRRIAPSNNDKESDSDEFDDTMFSNY